MNKTQPILSGEVFAKLSDDLYELIKNEIEISRKQPVDFAKLILMTEFYNLIRGESFLDLHEPVTGAKQNELYARYAELNSAVAEIEKNLSELDKDKADEWLTYYLRLFAPFNMMKEKNSKDKKAINLPAPLQDSPFVYKLSLDGANWYLVIFESDKDSNPYIPDLLEKYPKLFEYDDSVGSVILKTSDIPKDVLLELVQEDPYESFTILSEKEYTSSTSGNEVMPEGSKEFLAKYK